MDRAQVHTSMASSRAEFQTPNRKPQTQSGEYVLYTPILPLQVAYSVYATAQGTLQVRSAVGGYVPWIAWPHALHKTQRLRNVTVKNEKAVHVTRVDNMHYHNSLCSCRAYVIVSLTIQTASYSFRHTQIS